MLHRKSTVWSALCVLAVSGLTWAAPAHGFRMAQSKDVGQTFEFDAVRCDDSDGFAHWQDHSIVWRLNNESSTSARADSLGRALSTWSSVPGSDYSLTYGGLTANGFNVDGTNTVVWSTHEGCSTTLCLGLTSVVLKSGQVIVETDILMNDSLRWTINSSSPFDIEGTLAHELGHTLGIEHSNSSNTATMSPFNIGTAARTLESDDEDALRCSVNRYGIDRPGTDVTYRAHVKNKDWLQWVQNGATAGTTGESRRMEAAQLRIANGPPNMGICYQAYVGGEGWQEFVCDGKTAGTTGKGKRMEAIRIHLTRFPQGCSIEYRAHVRGLGWMRWVPYSQMAGTTGENRRMEALEVRLLGTCG